MSDTQSAARRTSAASRTAATGWSLGAAPRSYVISNVRVVLADRVTDPASAAVDHGRIAGVIERQHSMVGDVDGGGLLLLPGLVDVHSDALEKERHPRPSATLPWDFALTSLESKLIGAGVTTIFHGAAFQHKNAHDVKRNPETALELCEAVAAHHSSRVDHRILHRFTVRSAEGAEMLRRRLPEVSGSADGADAILLSHEDHTPGQGQYANTDLVIEQLVRDGLNRTQAATQVEQRIAEARSTDQLRDAHLHWVGELASSRVARVLGHDPDSASAIDALAARGGVVAEFPTTLSAARRAKQLGLLVVAGAPNVLRGESHSGNVAATELISAGLVDALASDYLPTALLGGVMILVRDGVLTLPEAVRLITAGPAAVAGLSDRGTIAPGMRADFALVDDRGRWPHVVATLTSTSTPVGNA